MLVLIDPCTVEERRFLFGVELPLEVNVLRHPDGHFVLWRWLSEPLDWNAGRVGEVVRYAEDARHALVCIKNRVDRYQKHAVDQQENNK